SRTRPERGGLPRLRWTTSHFQSSCPKGGPARARPPRQVRSARQLASNRVRVRIDNSCTATIPRRNPQPTITGPRAFANQLPHRGGTAISHLTFWSDQSTTGLVGPELDHSVQSRARHEECPYRHRQHPPRADRRSGDVDHRPAGDPASVAV